MSEFSDLAGKRDYRTPLPMTGKPYRKTYWDWTYHRWRTETCILLGAREVAFSVPYRERDRRPEGSRRRDRMDDGRHESPESYKSSAQQAQPPRPKAVAGTRRQSGPEPGSLRERIRQHLRKHGPATTAEIIAAVQWPNQRSVAAVINVDPHIVQVDGPHGKGRGMGGDKARWALRESAVQHG